MKIKLFVIALCAFHMMLLAQTSDSLQVREVFYQYKNAILNDQGNVAVQLVDSRTIGYYSDILLKALDADSATVNNLGLIDKLIVLSMRHRAPKDSLLVFKGADLFAYAVNNRMVGKDGASDSDISEVLVEGTFAKARIMVQNNPTNIYYHFYKENNAWKLDLTAIFPLSVAGLKKMIADSGDSENEVIFFFLEILTGKKPDNSVWHPLR